LAGQKSGCVKFGWLAIGPRHVVRIGRSFEMGKYEVTQAQWESVMGTNPSRFPGASRPVEQVSWEYAAGAGAAGPFAGPGLGDMAWYSATESANGGTIIDSKGETHPVGMTTPNAWGLYDMPGNVAESTPESNPAGPVEGEYAPLGPYHVARGGSRYSIASYLRVSDRYETVLGLRRRDIGFRCAREPAP
jgi:formylglycine-generating enzyme required for sulfatase activity